MRQIVSSRPAAAALIVISAGFALCAVEYSLHLSDGLRSALNLWVYNNVMLAAAAACVARGVLVRRDRAAWILVGAAVAAWGIGDTIWVFTVADDPNAPYPSAADVGFLAFYPPAYVALFLLLRKRIGTWRASLWLDGVIGALAVAAIGTAVVFQAVLEATGGSPAAVATNLAYPLADLTLIALVVWGLGVTGWRPGRTWGLIGAGLLVFSVSDSLYLYETAVGTYVNGGVTDIGWLAGGVLLAWAAWQPREETTRAAVDGWALLLAPVGFGLAALGVLVYDHAHRVHELVLVLAATAIAAVIARMALAFAENAAMVAGSRLEARTDLLTGLGNRRRLMNDLTDALEDGASDLVLALYDLNGFKLYNDSFGHPAGDALLGRLGQKLDGFVGAWGTAYRMGGDEFCILLRSAGTNAAATVEGAAAALTEQGEGFAISAAVGAVRLPAEGATPAEALRLADQRMYAHKLGARASAGAQSSSLLLRVLSERHPQLGDHVAGVADLAESVARALDLPPEEVLRARIAAELHDVGKMAIPDAILDKPGPLSEEEWTFVRRHPLIGERILLASPALAHVARLVRSTHERVDGAGYPDGLAGDEIPLISRIVFVCDAFDTMTAKGSTPEEALAELARNAGTQFDPAVVGALHAALATHEQAVAVAS
ncbi:MAG: diguanylate cyclase [Gaiellaceae bacterium]